jgi:hypothetical protein
MPKWRMNEGRSDNGNGDGALVMGCTEYGRPLSRDVGSPNAMFIAHGARPGLLMGHDLAPRRIGRSVPERSGAGSATTGGAV